MRRRYSLSEKKEIILDYIRKNPNATHRIIKRDTKLHVERVFKSLKEAFIEAQIPPPRTFDFKTREDRRRIIANFIKKNPGVGGHTIARDTKINLSNVFKDIKEAYDSAGVKYSREENTNLKKRSREERRKQIVELVKENPLISVSEIMNKAKCQPYKIFKNMKEIYAKAGINFVKKEEKWRLKKQKQVIEFIKQNPLATQREINKNCNTHVQMIFKKGIFEAYKKAKIKFPFERLKLYGIGIKEIRYRAKKFEAEIAIKLSGYGRVNRLVKTKRGFADIIFERKNKKAIIEIKDYQNKDISISQIKQLNKYLEDCECNLGFLICRNKPKKDKFLIGKNKIFILVVEELDKLPKLIDGSVV